jgi:hypothetical protein
LIYLNTKYISINKNIHEKDIKFTIHEKDVKFTIHEKDIKFTIHEKDIKFILILSCREILIRKFHNRIIH